MAPGRTSVAKTVCKLSLPSKFTVWAVISIIPPSPSEKGSGQPPDFQRFPILVKASEAEKNYLIPASSSTVTAKMMGTTTGSSEAPMRSDSGNIVESQKVYVGKQIESHIALLWVLAIY